MHKHDMFGNMLVCIDKHSNDIGLSQSLLKIHDEESNKLEL